MLHNKEKNTFEIKNGQITAELNYQIDHDGKMHITRTFVPEELRGKGLAAQLNKAALDYAKIENLKVVPVCSYTASYIERNTEYKSLL